MNTQILLIACLLGANNYNKIGNSLQIASFSAYNNDNDLFMSQVKYKYAWKVNFSQIYFIVYSWSAHIFPTRSNVHIKEGMHY